MTKKVYAELFRVAEEVLSQGLPVILDASFSKEKWRVGVRELAQKMNCPYFFIQCECPEEVLRQRLTVRQEEGGDVSDGHLALLEAFKKDFERLTGLPFPES
jgi:predicted kinase